MTFLNPAVVEGARIVARQSTNSAIATALQTLSGTRQASPSPTDASSSLLTSITPTTLSAQPTDTNTLANGGGNNNSGNNGGGPGGGGGSNSSSLLFFVALGFGVVFTNLWSVHRLMPTPIEDVPLILR